MGGGPKEGSSKKEDFKKQYKILDASRLQFLSYKHGLAKGKSDVELGRGAFGVVKRALFDGKIEVAVKSLIPPKDGVGANSNSTIQQYTASKGDALKLFIEEAKTMRQVDDHPQIVKFIGYIFETSSIVMEYVPGGSLYDYIHQNIDKMTWKQKYIIAKDVALGNH